MKQKRFWWPLALLMAIATVWGLIPNALAAVGDPPSYQLASPTRSKITDAERRAVAARMAAERAASNTATAAPQQSALGVMPVINVYDFYYGGIYPNYLNSPIPTVVGNTITGGIRKFVNTLPGLGQANANNLGQYIPIARADTNTYAGSDYYNIELVEYSQQVHSDLPPTKFRGYRDANGIGNDALPHYLGPLIIAQENRPVRIKFANKLPIGAAGDLFVPTDLTAMGAGNGPDGTPYKQNRATLHLHGGNTPWISDGTPHQWTVPAGETTNYKKGVSSQNVPDMPAAGDGEMTFYYTNQQSSRLMFYHDHAYGITRLNVYAGEAAGYLLVDPTEQALINSAVLPNNGGGNYTYGIPLIIQDKTFVPDPATVAAKDPTWIWGGLGQLWMPHVYMPNQNPNDITGMNPLGRWDYGPFFWPPLVGITYPPITLADGRIVPNLPNPSQTPESFMDTMLVNGTPYPTVTLAPTAYRFRILNACNDRFVSLNLFYVDNSYAPGTSGYKKEVKLVPAVGGVGYPANWPLDTIHNPEGVPDPAAQGPSFIQIGTEGGLLPAPVVIAPQPITFDNDPRSVTLGNIKNHGLYLGPAERADVIVDFSGVPAGSTLILYNDIKAPVPAFDLRYDYHPGAPDNTATGGAPTTIPGYGPNTRTIMQINIAGTATAPYNLAALQNAFASTATTTGAFAASQPVPFVPESGLGSAFNATYKDNYVRINQTTFTYGATANSATTTVSLLPKAIHELFTLDYGRMNAVLGVEVPNTNFNTQTTIPFGYIDPATEVFNEGQTQFWKITHNGVDTHAIHFHLFNVQVINRIGWDNSIRPPDANELGWKDTVKMNPLEDIVVAAQALKQDLPFGIPVSVRPLDVTQPLGGTMGFSGIDANNNPVTVVNVLTNFGWEYVWHCHLLGHEENDMMRPIVMNVPETRPTSPNGLTAVFTQATMSVALHWTDRSPNEIGFRIERATGNGAFAVIGSALANATSYVDTTVAGNQTYRYRIAAYNAAGTTYSAIVSVSTYAVARATGVTLSANPASPRPQGTAIVFSSAGQGGTGTYQYQFLLSGPSNGNVLTVTRAWGAANTWTWNTNATNVGNNTITVQVRSLGNLGTAESSRSMAYTISGQPAATGATISAAPASPRLAGTPITFSATGVGGSGSYEFQFLLRGPSTGNVWTSKRAYATSNTWTWTPTAADAGTSSVMVYVRSQGNAAAFEASATTTYSIGTVALATSATIVPSPVSPRAAGTAITFTATGVGGTGTYQFQFLVKGPGTGNVFVSKRAYSSTPTYTWTPTASDVGVNAVMVYVRSQGNLTTYDAYKSINYTVTP